MKNLIIRKQFKKIPEIISTLKKATFLYIKHCTQKIGLKSPMNIEHEAEQKVQISWSIHTTHVQMYTEQLCFRPT